MASGIVHLDDLAAFDDRVRNQNVLTEAASNSLCDRRFAVSRRTVDEHPLAGIDRRAKLGKQLGLDVNIGKRLFQLRLSRPFGRQRLRMYRANVVFERHGRRTDIRTFSKRPQRSIAAGVRQPIDVVAEHRGPTRRNLLPLTHRDQAILENCHREAEVVRYRAAALRADTRQKLEDQLLNESIAEPRVLERQRLLRLKAVVESEDRN